MHIPGVVRPRSLGDVRRVPRQNNFQRKFGTQCAASPDAVEQSRAAPEPANSGPTGERRHLTVLFGDLVGSTAVASQLDPEEWREMVAGYHRAAAEAMTRFGGHVAKYLGDGVMAFFGQPEMHERAARAGPGILDAIAKLGDRPTHAKLSARIGVDSGTVVVGAGADKEADVFGDAPNIAARVEVTAPGTLAITDATHRLLSGLFLVEDLGAQTLKGFERSVRLYCVMRPRGAQGRPEAAASSAGLTSFVGREDELRTLAYRWDHVREGEGPLALTIGEAGIGKSRLLHRFSETIVAWRPSGSTRSPARSFRMRPFIPSPRCEASVVRWRRGLPRRDRAPSSIDLLIQTRRRLRNQQDVEDVFEGEWNCDQQSELRMPMTDSPATIHRCGRT
jgi:class 3 adenylate cyclase